MAWQNPTHTCGHQGERYQAYGKRDGRERQLRAIESRPCPNCQMADAQKKAEESGLPQLVGSPKQIAWASDIRDRAMRLLPAEKTEKLRPETSAKWWIDNREVANA